MYQWFVVSVVLLVMTNLPPQVKRAALQLEKRFVAHFQYPVIVCGREVTALVIGAITGYYHHAELHWLGNFPIIHVSSLAPR